VPDLVPVPHRTLSEKEREERAHPGLRERMVELAADLLDPIGQATGQGRQPRVQVRCPLDPAQHGQARGGRERISAQRTGLIHRTGGGDPAHEIGAASVGADRQPAAQDLAQRGQVRPDPIHLLRPARGQAEARHDLVEDQDRAVLVTERAQILQEPRQRRDTSHVAGHRLDNDGRHLSRVSLQQGADRAGVVVARG